MKETTKYHINNAVKKILDRTMKETYPELNTKKIAEFYTNALEWTLNLTSTIILILTFTWYFPNTYGMKPETAIIILLCIIILELRNK